MPLFDEKDLANPETFIQKLKTLEESEEEEQDKHGKGNLVRKKRRRPAGEISGRQMAIKKLKKKGGKRDVAQGKNGLHPSFQQ